MIYPRSVTSMSAPNTASSPPERATGHDIAAIAAIAMFALVVRLPALLSNRHLTFDDGVYGSASLALRDGNVPFQDVYSPQGPAYLATVWIFDLLTGRFAWSPRTSSTIAGVAITVATWSLVRGLTNQRIAAASAIAIAGSGSLGWVTAPMAGDGIAIAWSVIAVAIAARAQGRYSQAAIAGLAMGMAVSTKVLVAPAALLILAVIVSADTARRSQIRQIATFTAATCAVVGAWFVAFDIALVWEQSVEYHAFTPRLTSMGANLSTVVTTAVRRDPILVVALIVMLFFAVRHGRGWSPVHRITVCGASAWLIMSTIVLVVQKATFRAHVSSLVTPAVVLVALLAAQRLQQRQRTPTRAATAICVGVFVSITIVAQFNGLVAPRQYSSDERAAVTALKSLPTDGLVITDEPGLAWAAQREMPGWLIDPGIKRFFGDDLEAGPRSIFAELNNPRVCAVVVWTFRFGSLVPGLESALVRARFEPVATFGTWVAPDGKPGRRQIWFRDGCPTLAL